MWTVVHGLLQSIVVDSARGSPDKALYLWSDAPRFEVSTAPLADKDGQAVQLPDTLHADHALFLSDQQVSICVSSFKTKLSTSGIFAAAHDWSQRDA